MRRKRVLYLFLIIPLFAGCTTWNAGMIEPKGEPNRLGFTSKTKVTEPVAIAMQTQQSLKGLKDAAFSAPACNPNLSKEAEMACVIGNSVAMGIAFALGRPVTAAGEIAQAGRDAIRASAQGLTQRSAARWRAATFGLSGLFAFKTAEVIGENNAAIAQTVAQHGGIRIGTLNHSQSRHSGNSSAHGDGASFGGSPGHPGDSNSQLIIGNNNVAGFGQGGSRITGAANDSMSNLAETSANQAAFQDVDKPLNNTTSDDFDQQAPTNVSDDDGGNDTSLF